MKDETNDAAKWLLTSSGVGCLAGVAMPAFWVSWAAADHPLSEAAMIVVMVFLLCPLAGVISFGFRSRQIILGIFAAIVNLIVAGMVFFLTWLTVPPSALVGLWLLLAGVLWAEGQAGLRRRLLPAGLVTAGVSMVVSWALPYIPAVGDYLGALINLALAVWLIRAGVRGVHRQHPRDHARRSVGAM